MGIPIPPPDEPDVPSGIVCQYLHMADMPYAKIAISGVVCHHPHISWSPNGKWVLHPAFPCGWTRTYYLGPESVTFGLYFTATTTEFGIGYSSLGGMLQVYYYWSRGSLSIGENQWIGWWTGGTHVVFWVHKPNPNSLQKLAEDLRINSRQLTTAEPISQYPITQEAVQRISRPTDKTCLYVRRHL